MIDIKRKYKTRSGLEVVLASTEMPGGYPILGLIKDKEGDYLPQSWDLEGKFIHYIEEHSKDLIEVKEPKILKCWVNFYVGGRVDAHCSQASADSYAIAKGLHRLVGAVEVCKEVEE